MNQPRTARCPKCAAVVQVPFRHRSLELTCEECGQAFYWTFHLEHDREKPKQSGYLRRIAETPVTGGWQVVGVLLVLAVLFGVAVFSETPPGNRPESPSSALPAVAESPIRKASWINISYGDLLDENTLTQSGRRLIEVLGDETERGSVQALVGPHSELLPPAIDMIKGPPRTPHCNVLDRYPVGSEQPAWVALCRSGRFQIETDGTDHARVFLPGEHPQQAYEDHYSAIRHCLNEIASATSRDITIEVFAYRHDYANSRLQVDTEPYTVTGASFPSAKKPLDLEGLRDFFASGIQLEGASLERSDGLALYGTDAPQPTLAGQDLGLSDFAVAYRAAFHAGENEAFVSLDPHADPTKVTINFGGLLEDTHLGAVVLEADKRFKTISSGLDPNTFDDVRSAARQEIPGFLTSSERWLIRSEATTKIQWIGTRFWYYPDAVGVESDFQYTLAAITKAHFTADAERSRDDFRSLDEFERKKKETLSPEISECIEHLNKHRTEYEVAFPDLQELQTVARLMGICSWLYAAAPDWIDLDSLLSVTIPSFHTSREKLQLITAALITCDPAAGLTRDQVAEQSQVFYLTPILDLRISEYFKDADEFAKFALLRAEYRKSKADGPQDDLSTMMLAFEGDQRISQILETEGDLKALAEHATECQKVPSPPPVRKLEIEVAALQTELKNLESQLDDLQRRMTEVGANEYNSLVDQHNRLVDRYETRRRAYNEKVNILNHMKTPAVIKVSGGIDLSPKHFKVRQSFDSPQLERIGRMARTAETEWLKQVPAGWRKSRTQGSDVIATSGNPPRPWERISAKQSSTTTIEHWSDADSRIYWCRKDTDDRAWRDVLIRAAQICRERQYDADNSEIHIARFRSNEVEDYVVGRRDGDNIVFSKSSRRDLIAPTTPPRWWHDH